MRNQVIVSRVVLYTGLLSAFVWTGSLRAEIGRLSMPAEAALERIAALRVEVGDAPEDADRWTSLAWLLYRYGQDTTGALEAAERACRLDPTSFKARELAGRLYFLRGRNDRALDHWVRLLEAPNPEAQMYLGAISGLAADARRLDEVISALQEVEKNHPNERFRTIATRQLAGFALASGRVDEAEAMPSNIGMIDRWMIIGPFNNERNARYDTAYGPETEIDFDASYQGRDRMVWWRPLEHLTFGRGVDFAAVCYPRVQVLGYVLTYVHSPVAQDATLCVGASKAVKLWFNDRLAWASELERGFVPDQMTLPVRLQRGFNKLLVKVGVENGRWRLAVRVTDPRGRPVEGLTYSRSVETTPDGAASDAPDFDFTPTMMEHFGRLADADPTDEDALYYLGIAQQANLLPTEASKTFERLATLNDRCGDHHRLLARAYSRDDKAEKSLVEMKTGLEVDPDNLQIRLMLARFYNGRRLYRKEREVLEEIASRHPGWREAEFQWIENYTDEGWEEPAFRKTKQLHESRPTDFRALVSYTQMCGARGYADEFEELVGRILELDYTNAFARRRLLDLAISRKEYQKALGIFEILGRLSPLRYELHLEQARLLSSVKRYDEALEHCRQALDICDTDYAIHRQIGIVRQRMHDDPGALAAFKEALEYRPDHRWLRQYVEYLEPDQNVLLDAYAMDSDGVDELLARKVTRAEYPRSSAVMILDEMVVRIFDDGSSTYRIHQIVKILDDAGRNQWTRVGLPPGSNKVQRAVVIQPDGNEVEATQITNSGIHFAQLQPGSIVQFVVLGYARANDWMGRHYNETFLFQTNNPMLTSRFVVLAPLTKPINTWHQGEHVTVRTESIPGHRVHLWEARDVPRIQTEPNRPPFMDLCEQVRVSTIPDWKEIAKWEHALIKEQFEADHDLNVKTNELVRGLSTTHDKIRALSNFVAQDIQYKIVRGGIFGYKPNKAANVLHNEWGDCKDKATLLITMLQVVGIEAHYATIRTRDAGRLIETIPSNQCNHAIVFIPRTADLDQDLWVDGTALEHGIDALPWNDQDVAAMVWGSEGELSFMRTPIEGVESTVSDMRFEVTLSADGDADVRGRWEATGQIAATLRNSFKQPGRRAEQLSRMINRFAPGSVLRDFTFSDLEDRDAPVTIEQRFETSNYAVSSGSDLLLRTKQPFRVTAQFAPGEVRHYDVWIPFRQRQSSTEVYRIPAGYRIRSTPEPVRLTTPWMEFVSTVERGVDTLTVSRELTIKALSIPREEYGRFREFCIAVDEYEQKAVVLRRVND